MEIIELSAASIPFNIKNLEKDKYLPVSIFDELGNYYTLAEGRIFKTNQEMLIGSIKKIFESDPKAKFPESVQSMAKERYKEMEKLMKAVPHFQENRYLMEVPALQRSFIFKQYNELNFLLKKAVTDLDKSHFEYMAAPALKRQTAYGDTNVDTSLEEKYGIGIKKQDGSSLSGTELQEAEDIISAAFGFFKIPKGLAAKAGLIISFTHNKSMKSAGHAAGVFIPNYKAIGVSFSDGYNGNISESEKILAHETGHWIDAVSGINFGSFASSKQGTIQSVLAFSVLSSMNDDGLATAYWCESTECFARAFEEYFAVEALRDYSYFARKYYCPENEYENRIKPLIRLIVSDLQKKS